MGPSRGLFVVCTLHQRCAHVRALSAKFGRVYPPNHTILNLRHQVLLAWRSGTLPARRPAAWTIGAQTWYLLAIIGKIGVQNGYLQRVGATPHHLGERG